MLESHRQTSRRAVARSEISHDQHSQQRQAHRTEEASRRHGAAAGNRDRRISPDGTLTMAQAREIVAPLYDALNEPLKKDVLALLSQAANPDYRSCSTNQDCLGRDALAAQFKVFGSIIPDLRWTIKEVWTSGNRIVVRGEASGTPVAPLFGVKPSGKASAPSRSTCSRRTVASSSPPVTSKTGRRPCSRSVPSRHQPRRMHPLHPIAERPDHD
jgi:predicted ester cyclase